MKMILKVLGVILMVVGALAVYSAGWIVDKYGLDKNVPINFEHTMEGDELIKFKRTRALVNVKMLGMLIMLPGLVFIIIAFR